MKRQDDDAQAGEEDQQHEIDVADLVESSNRRGRERTVHVNA